MKKTFKVKIDGVEKEFFVSKPNEKQLQKAQLVRAKAFREALKEGAFANAELNAILRERKIWDDEKEKRYRKAQDKIAEGEKILARDGRIKISEAKKLALEVSKARGEIRVLRADWNDLYQQTAEAHSENSWFNFLVSCCTFAEGSKPHFRDYDDYQSRDNDPVTKEAGRHLAELIYQFDESVEAKLPENVFLKRFGFIDEKLRLINDKKELVDEDGRRVNEEGFWINEDGEPVDRDGNRIDKDGNYVGEPQFLPDEAEAGVTTEVP